MAKNQPEGYSIQFRVKCNNGVKDYFSELISVVQCGLLEFDAASIALSVMEINYGTSTETFQVDMQSLQGTLNSNYDSVNCPLDTVEVLNEDCTDDSAHGMDPAIVSYSVAGGVVTFSMDTTTRDNIDYNVCIKAKKGIQSFVKTQRIRLNKCIGVI